MFTRALLAFALVLLPILTSPIAAAAEGKEKIFGQGSTDGTFVEIEQGDYFYFVIKDKKGERVAFPLLTEPPSVAPYSKKPAAFVGKPVRVYWQDKSRHVPEAGGMVRDKICVRVEVPKK